MAVYRKAKVFWRSWFSDQATSCFMNCNITHCKYIGLCGHTWIPRLGMKQFLLRNVWRGLLHSRVLWPRHFTEGKYKELNICICCKLSSNAIIGILTGNIYPKDCAHPEGRKVFAFMCMKFSVRVLDVAGQFPTSLFYRRICVILFPEDTINKCCI